MADDACGLCQSIAAVERTHQGDGFVVAHQTGYVSIFYAQYFKGHTVFMARDHVEEPATLDPARRALHLDEMGRVSEAIYNIHQPKKMNYAALGNNASTCTGRWYPATTRMPFRPSRPGRTRVSGRPCGIRRSGRLSAADRRGPAPGRDGIGRHRHRAAVPGSCRPGFDRSEVGPAAPWTNRPLRPSLADVGLLCIIYEVVRGIPTAGGDPCSERS